MSVDMPPNWVYTAIVDAPISRVDLLTCRNTLMYFMPEAQQRILANFHFALRQSGYLFLGKSEMMLGRSSLFVYWIHVEMAYGGIARPLRRELPLELSLVATVALCALLYAIVKWKDRKMAGRELTGAWRIFAPILK